MALYPDVTVPPCSAVELSGREVVQGEQRLDDSFLSDESEWYRWVPAGTTYLDLDWARPRIEKNETVTVVVFLDGLPPPRRRGRRRC